MATVFVRILAFLLLLSPIWAIPWTGPQSTLRWNAPSRTVGLTTAASTPTAQAMQPLSVDGNSTSGSEDPELCGYVDRNFVNSYTCGSQKTCLWNSKLRRVGCGSPTSIDYITSCVAFNDLSSCDSACQANPSIIRCGSDVPHCVTPRFGARGNYSILGCEARPQWDPYTVFQSYNGQNTTGHLPRYLGENGKLTFGTVIPKLTATAASPPVSAATLALPEIAITTEVVTTAERSNASDLPPPPPPGPPPCQVNARIIVGVVIGFGILLAFAAIALCLFFVWKHRKEVRLAKEREKQIENGNIDVEVQNAVHREGPIAMHPAPDLPPEFPPEKVAHLRQVP
ncbi:hypothetical protein B0J14DRAFT_53903 [Halenospora varia]|nr:hypothetical protein B0J14DRAFT_53903 [Halenospora varia]